MGLEDLERQTVRFTHPAHPFASLAMLFLTLAAGVCIAIAAALASANLPLDELGPRPDIVNCHLDPTRCSETLPEWLRDPIPEARVEELAFQRIRGELEAERARIVDAHPPEWAARAESLGAGQQKTMEDWISAEGDVSPLPKSGLTPSTSPTPWDAWADTRAQQVAAQEIDAYRAAWTWGRLDHFDDMLIRSKRARSIWETRRRQRMRVGIAVSSGVLGALTGLMALATLAMRRWWAPFTVVLSRHAVIRGEGAPPHLLAGLSELELQGLIDELTKVGHHASCGRAALLDAIRDRRDAAERGRLPPPTHQHALDKLLERRTT